MQTLDVAVVETKENRFHPGRIGSTPGAILAFALSDTSIKAILTRHLQGDWGDVVEDDKKANDEALYCGGRLVSAYDLPGSDQVWVITEADRSSTTFLLPDEY